METEIAPTVSTVGGDRLRLSQPRQALLAFYWLAFNVQWSAVLIVTMPSQIKSAVGNDAKGTALGVALGIGAFISMVAAPAFGALSDRIRLPFGRRKPWVVLGTLGNMLGLVGLAFLIQPGQPENTVTLTLGYVEPESLLRVTFETTSAFGTVGLSMTKPGMVTSISALFSPFGKLLIILTMFAGRVGPITVGAALLSLGVSEPAYRYPEDRVMIG
jgi:hypothetical protein